MHGKRGGDASLRRYERWLRWRKRIRRATGAIVIASALLWLISGHWRISVGSCSGGLKVQCGAGAVSVLRVFSPPRFAEISPEAWSEPFSVTRHHDGWADWGRAFAFHVPEASMYLCCLWIVIGIVIGLHLLLELALWRRRPARPNECLHCRYDLTGNVSGVCPECGRPVVQ